MNGTLRGNHGTKLLSCALMVLFCAALFPISREPVLGFSKVFWLLVGGQLPWDGVQRRLPPDPERADVFTAAGLCCPGAGDPLAAAAAVDALLPGPL